MSRPKVSVLITCYNQERYVEQTVRSVLSQEVSFPVEIVIGEDASRDRTRSVLEKLDAEFPARLTLLTRANNVGMMRNYLDAWSRCKGQYLAVLDGDDYWTDPLKLQKQVNALESHPEWAICFHKTLFVHETGDLPPTEFPVNFTREVSTIDDIIQDNFIQTCSVMYRHGFLERLPDWFGELALGDWPTHILQAQFGDIGFLPDIMATYRIHGSSTWSSGSLTARVQSAIAMLDKLEGHLGPKHREAFAKAREAQVRHLVGRIEDLEKLKDSLSWKITAPFRWAADALQRLRRRSGS